ncbi:hypothetical protein EYF80_009407 [Liparis tanakae]|uniref:Uncharacterized protein n=1 Tax=Liparis tanakae TaxID=230148 RepID=A0A4Z2IT78_9TELE|nr:hypothetical protein EYF80_009407 [Liparis tanakae]
MQRTKRVKRSQPDPHSGSTDGGAPLHLQVTHSGHRNIDQILREAKISAVKGLKVVLGRFAQPSSKRGKDSKDWEGAGDDQIDTDRFPQLK